MSNHRVFQQAAGHVFIALIAVSLSVFSCKEEKPAEIVPAKPSISGVVLFTIGEVTLVKQDQTEAPLEMQAKVSTGESVRTGAKSSATIQFQDKGLVRIQENSSISFSELFSTGTGEILLKDGQVLTKINKLMKSEEFRIKTPTAVASVRGTEYSTEYRDGKSVIAVKTGKVAVSTKEAATEGAEPVYTEKAVVEEGNTATVSSEGEGAVAATKVETRPISEIESLTVKKVSIINMLPEPEKASKSELEDMQRSVMKEEIKIDEDLAPKIKHEKIIMMIERKSNTLAEIKEVFERIDEISLYNGRIIQGAIISRGAKYKVLTTTGATDINEADIKKVRVIK